MSKLEAFLKPTVSEISQEVTVSDRFVDEEGKPATIKIKAITQQMNNSLIKKCTVRQKDKGQLYEHLDKPRYQAMLVQACVVEPDFSQKEICDAYGVVDPLEVPVKMFFSGEYAKLIEAIMEINGFKDGEELAEDAKN